MRKRKSRAHDRRGLLNYLHRRAEHFPLPGTTWSVLCKQWQAREERLQVLSVQRKTGPLGGDGSINGRRWWCDWYAGNDALNVSIKSQYNQGEFIDGHWAINIGKKYSIYFYPSNKTWRESHSDASSVTELWKNKKEVEQGLSNVLMGHFSDCLKKWWPHSREMPSK